MKKTALLFCFCLMSFSLTGCADQGGDVVENAEQSAIDAYKEAQAAEQAQMDQEMGGGAK